LAPTLGQRFQTGQPQLSWKNSGESTSKSWSLVYDLLVLVTILYFFESFAIGGFCAFDSLFIRVFRGFDDTIAFLSVTLVLRSF